MGFDELNAVLAETRGRLFKRRAARDELEAIPRTLAELLDLPSEAAVRRWRDTVHGSLAVALPDPPEEPTTRCVMLCDTEGAEAGEVVRVPDDQLEAMCACGYVRPASPAEVERGHAFSPLHISLRRLRRAHSLSAPSRG